MLTGQSLSRLCMNTTLHLDPGGASRTGVIPKLSQYSSHQYLGPNKSPTGSADTHHRSDVRERLRSQIIQKSFFYVRNTKLINVAFVLHQQKEIMFTC